VCCLCALESLAPVAQCDYEASALFSKLDAAAVCGDDDRVTFSLFANALSRTRAVDCEKLIARGTSYYSGGETVGDTRLKGRLGVSLEGRLARRHSL
jgi:hypothetical protein